MKRYLAMLMAGLFLATGAYAAKEAVERYGGQFPVWFDKGIYVGHPASNVDQDTIHRIKAIRTCDLTNVAIAAGAANVQVNTTATCTGMAIGDQILAVTPMQDDAALDDAVITGFVESTNTIKLQVQCDVTGCDLADTNEYRILYLQH